MSNEAAIPDIFKTLRLSPPFAPSGLFFWLICNRSDIPSNDKMPHDVTGECFPVTCSSHTADCIQTIFLERGKKNNPNMSNIFLFFFLKCSSWLSRGVTFTWHKVNAFLFYRTVVTSLFSPLHFFLIPPLSVLLPPHLNSAHSCL